MAGYAGVPVVRGVDLDVSTGEVVALLGSNGAGKTTTLLAVFGLLEPLGGLVEVLSAPARRPHHLARRGAALVPQGRSLFLSLTVAENLRMARGDPDEALALFPALESARDRLAGRLSGGEQQMLALARALAGRPRLLVVDELSLGLAPRVVEDLMAGIRRRAQEHGTAVLVVEQHVAVALAVADRAYVMERGTIVLEGTSAELARRPDVLESTYLGGP